MELRKKRGGFFVILSVCSFIFNEWISAINVIILKMNPSNAPEGFKKGHQGKKMY